MMEPIKVCELDDGRPKYQVPRFHRMAAINSANTMAKPAPLLTCRISSTGSNDMIPKATAPLDTSTPRKLKHPDHTTARLGGMEWVYMTVATALAVSWKPFTNSKARAMNRATPSRM